MSKRVVFVFAIVFVFVAAVAAAFLDARAAGRQTDSSAAMLSPAPRIVCAPVDPAARQREVIVELTFDDSPRALCPEGTAPVRFDLEFQVQILTGEPPPVED